MAWRPHSKCAVNPQAPRAAGVCDRCSQWFQHNQLRYQYEWSGTELYNTQFLVCSKCYDVPFIQRKTTRLPPDPLPILNPRVEQFFLDEEGPQALNWDTAYLDWDVINSDNVWDES